MDNAAKSRVGEHEDGGRLLDSAVESSKDQGNSRRKPVARSRILDRSSLMALGLYFAVSVTFIGRRLIFDFGSSHVGLGTDPSFFVWSIAWWRYALCRGLNPIFTHVIYAPGSTNLAWATTVPLASVIVWPITATFGPITAYNFLALLAPALAAWAAFILCRYLTKIFWPAVVAGYVFGFSPYLLAQVLGGHLNLALIFPIPIALYLVAQWFNREIGPRTMVCLMGLTMAAQVLLSVEVFATATVFAALALLLGLSSTACEPRRRIVNLIGVLASAYGLALVIVSPYFYYMFAYGQPSGAIWDSILYSTDLLNFVIPTKVNALGALRSIGALAAAFPGNIFERDAYVGPVLIMLAILFARRNWRQPFGKTLIDSLVVICVLSIGPVLHVGGHQFIGMPGYLLTVIPFANKALPSRFMMFAFLILAIITAQWFTMSKVSAKKKCIVAALLVLFSLPNLNARFWNTNSDTPEFFARRLYRLYLAPDENVLVTPYWRHGNSMLWQAQSGFYFHMAGGWTGPIPAAYMQWPVVRTLTEHWYLPDAQMQLMSFLANHQVGAIVSADSDPAHLLWPQWLPAGAAQRLKIGGVTLYRIRPEALATYRSITATEAERKADWELFNGVLVAVSRYVDEGRDPAQLSSIGITKAGPATVRMGAWRSG